MTIFTWRITSMKRDAATGGVIEAFWRLEAVDGDFTEMFNGGAQFQPDANSPAFVPFEALTEADVLAWVWSSGCDKAGYEAAIEQRLSERRAPKILQGVPWQ